MVGVGLDVERSRERYRGGATAGFDNNKKGGVFLKRVEKSCSGVVGLHGEGCSFTSRLA